MAVSLDLGIGNITQVPMKSSLCRTLNHWAISLVWKSIYYDVLPVGMSGYSTRVTGASRGQKGLSAGTEVTDVLNHCVGSGIEPTFSARSVSALKHWAISPTPGVLLFVEKKKKNQKQKNKTKKKPHKTQTEPLPHIKTDSGPFHVLVRRSHHLTMAYELEATGCQWQSTAD